MNLPWRAFTVKSVCIIARSILGKHGSPHDYKRDIWHLLWSSTISPCVKHFIWRLVLNRIHTTDNLGTKGVVVDKLCKVCDSTEETVSHLFFDFPLA